MNSPRDPALLHRTLQRAWTLWAALLATLVVYLALAEWLGPLAEWPFGRRDPLLLYGVTGLWVAAAWGLRRVLLRPGPGGQGPAAARYLVAVVAPLALCETAAVLALVLMLLGLPPDTGRGLVLVAALGMLPLRPRRTELERLLAGRPPG